MSGQSAFYARTGTRFGDFWTLLHPPYTLWNVSYVAIGAALAPTLDWFRLTLTLVAFAAGTGVASHALDELNGRPLKTGFTDRELKLIGLGGFAGALFPALIGAWIISPWVLAFAAVGVILVMGYTLEWWNGAIHTDLGFALSWGGFPVLVGFWAQAEGLQPETFLAAGAAVLFSMAQRRLSTPARFVRRRALRTTVEFTTAAGEQPWSTDELLSSWERPLRLLAWTVVLLALALLFSHLPPSAIGGQP
jgi:hypothetical protein